jgi:iron complex transport system permease protein
VVVILLFARSLNVMQLDEEQAQQLGINVERVKLILLVAATLITAAAVSFVGTIGFIGIITPHMVRLVWGPDHRFLLPLSVLAGAVFLILADLGAEVIKIDQVPSEVKSKAAALDADWAVLFGYPVSEIFTFIV